MRSLILACLSASFCLAQATSSTPVLVGAGFSNPFPLTVAPGQLLTLYVQPPASYYSTEPMPSPSAVFWNGSDEAMPVLQIYQVNTGCAIPGNSAGCPNLLAVTVQIPFDAPVNPVVGSDIAVRPSGIAVFVSGGKSSYFGAQAISDQVHIITACDALFNQAPIEQNIGGAPCTPTVTHSDGTPVSVNSPAMAGEELVAYATGLGQTNPALTTGQAAAASSPTIATYNLDFNYRPNALATRPSQTAAVPLFAGATKGYIGLYQINFIVPPPPAGLAPCVSSGVSPDIVSGDFISGVFSNLTVSVGSIFSFDGAGICVQPSSDE
jgi:uncharacterized protein (TIGR03437 family)